jgi:tripartite-type tricarboxylate transporter receptor subunit TctC
MNRLATALCALATALLLLLPAVSPVRAQAWPQRPVRLILPLGAGSGVDTLARIFADRLSARWHQPVVVENRPGGDGIVAISAFISAHDDHVLLFAPTSSFTAHPLQNEKMPYDPRELSPIVRVSNTIVVFAVPASLKVGSVKDLFDQVRAQPGKLNFTTATGVTDYIFDAYFKSSGLAMTRVPYRDTVQALSDLGEARIQAYIGALTIAQPHVQAGRAKLIAITNSTRAAMVPDLPTIGEAGYPALTFDGLTGLFGPRDLADAIRERIVADVRAVAADQEIVARLAVIGQVVSPGTAAEFAAAIAEQQAKAAAVGRELGIKMAPQ